MCKSSTSCSNLVLCQVISSEKFPIILAKSTLDDTDEYIIKAFNEDTSSLCSYLREKKFLSSLDHSNIIKYIPKASFKVDNIPNGTKFIIMEYAPYGDFFNLVFNNHLKNEKLVRTYFHQLIDGIEHLHQKGIAHLDLKLENLLLGKDLLLKIADFDVAQSIEDKTLVSQGSVNYRAPELIEGACTNYQAADIFSAGVCLFSMISRIFPFLEDGEEIQRRVLSYDQFLYNNESYWNGIDRLLRKKSLFSQSLRELLMGMWKKDPNQRFSVEEIKQSEWYKQPIFSSEELKEVFGLNECEHTIKISFLFLSFAVVKIFINEDDKEIKLYFPCSA